MNIALVGPAHPLRGGIADFNEALARSLQLAGHRVRIFSFSVQYPSFLFPGKTQFTDSPIPADLDIRTCINSVGPLSWFSTIRSIREFRPDLVVVRYWLPFMAPALGTIVRRFKKDGIPVISITDNVLPHEQRPGDKALTRYFVRSCDGFVAMSRSVLNDLSAFTETSHRIFQPHPVYDIFGKGLDKSNARKLIGVEAQQPTLLFFGFIRPYKGLRLLIEAMADQRLRHRGVRLVVAGEFYEDSRPYHELVDRLGLKDSIRFDSEYIPKEHVNRYFCAADLVVQPYVSATQSGITQIAYHFGRPMLVTDVGGLSEIVDHGKTGYVVPVDVKAISDAIEDYFATDRESVMSQAVRIKASGFSWSSFTSALTSLHARIVEEKS